MESGYRIELSLLDSERCVTVSCRLTQLVFIA